MSRQRFIYPQMLTSENFISLSREARLLFVGLIAVADDYGRGKGSPRSLKATVFPADEDVTAADVAGWCDELAGQGMARFYSDGNGQRFYDLPAWSKYQSPRYKAKSQVPCYEDVPRSPAEPPEDLRQKRREEKRSEEKRGRTPPPKKPAAFRLDHWMFEQWQKHHEGAWSKKDWACANRGIKLCANEAQVKTSWLAYLQDTEGFVSGHYPDRWASRPAAWPKPSIYEVR